MYEMELKSAKDLLEAAEKERVKLEAQQRELEDELAELKRRCVFLSSPRVNPRIFCYRL